MIESLRSMASSATAFVKSIVSRTEFIWRRSGSNGASSSTIACKHERILPNPSTTLLRPVLSKLLSASDSGYLPECQPSMTFQQKLSTRFFVRGEHSPTASASH